MTDSVTGAPATVSGGRMSWADAVSGPLGGATCLWQDLDGLHCEPIPAQAPPTSIVWGWRGDDLFRLRLDANTVHLATCTVPRPAVQLAGWSAGDGRVAGYRPASAQTGPLGAAYEQVVVDGIAEGTGPVMFVRLARRQASGQPPR